MMLRLFSLFKILVSTTCLLNMLAGETLVTDATGNQVRRPIQYSEQYAAAENVQDENKVFGIPASSYEEVPGHIGEQDLADYNQTAGVSAKSPNTTVQHVTAPVEDQLAEGDVAEVNNLEGGNYTSEAVELGEGDKVYNESDNSGDSEGGENDMSSGNSVDNSTNGDNDDINSGNGFAYDEALDISNFTDGEDAGSSDGTAGSDNDSEINNDGSGDTDGGESGDGNHDDDTYDAIDVDYESSNDGDAKDYEKANETSQTEGKRDNAYGGHAKNLPFKHPGLIKHEEAVEKILAGGPREPRPTKKKARKIKYSRKNIYNYKSLKPKKVDDKCKCGEGDKAKSSRIVNGAELSPNNFPWMVSIQYKGYDMHFCGGTVICDKYILSAAHCADGLSAKEVSIRLGDHNLNRDDIDTAVTIDVAKIIMHKAYNPETTDMDIALFKLKKKLNFKKLENVAPICLTPPDIAYYRETVIVPGWGNVLEDAESTSPVINFVELTVLSMRSCRTEFELFPSEISQYMLCAFRKDHDACQGDSGGPMVYHDRKKKQYFQMAIVSWGIGCARPDFPGVYTKLSKVVGWVYDNAKDCTFCKLSEPSNIKPGKRTDVKKIRHKNKRKKKKKKKKRYKNQKGVRNRKPERQIRRGELPKRKGGRRKLGSGKIIVKKRKPKRRKSKRGVKKAEK